MAGNYTTRVELRRGPPHFADDVRAVLSEPTAYGIPIRVRQLIADAADHIDALARRVDQLQQRVNELESSAPCPTSQT